MGFLNVKTNYSVYKNCMPVSYTHLTKVYELLMCYLMLLNDQNKLWIFGFCRFSLHTELI